MRIVALKRLSDAAKTLTFSELFFHVVNDTVTLFSLYLYYYQMNHSVFWTITSIWPDLSIRGNKCPIGDDQLSQL